MLSFEPLQLPLMFDKSGTARVGGTRVRLDTVVYAFNQGLAAEDILDQFPELNLLDILLVFSLFLE